MIIANKPVNFCYDVMSVGACLWPPGSYDTLSEVLKKAGWPQTAPTGRQTG